MSRRALSISLLVVALATAAVWRSYPERIPPFILDSYPARPLIRLFDYVRERVYFGQDDSCLEALAAYRVPFAFTARPVVHDDCPLRNVVRMLPGAVVGRPLYMTCRLALSLTRFLRETVEPAAEHYFGTPVARFHDLGVRNCRTVEGYRRLLSEHAYANAIDVAGFVLSDGTTISVGKDWNGTGPRAAFLHEVSAAACRTFKTVLVPGFDERHGDHLHLDMGLIGGCRAPRRVASRLR